MIKHAEQILAVRYAEAFLNVQQHPFPDDMCQALGKAVQYYRSMSFLLFYLQMPIFTEENKQSVLTLVRRFYKLPESLEKLDVLLLTQGRIALVPLGYAELIRQSYIRAGYITCTVTTAIPLSHAQQEACRQFVMHLTEKRPLITWHVDPSLIAGVRFQSESWVWENSLDARLRALANTLLI